MSDDEQMTPAEELRTLIGHQEVELGSGEKVRVQAYGFLDSAQAELIALESGLIDRLGALMPAPGDLAGLDTTALKRALFADMAALIHLVALSVGRPVAWVKALSGDDGQLVLLAWWSLNQLFFLRSAAIESGIRAGRSAAAAGSPSSPGSSATGTASPS